MTEQINARLKKEGKFEILDRKEHIEAISAMNKRLETVRRQFQIKEKRSQISAASVVLTM